MEKYFAIYTIYNDRMEKKETADTIVSALETVAIYLRDPDCRYVMIKDLHDGKVIFRFWNE